MNDQVEVSLVTHDPRHDELVIYLVEEGPWPTAPEKWKERLLAIQTRALGAFWLAVDGGLIERFPEAAGKRVRVQIDSPSGQVDEVERLVDALGIAFERDPELAAVLESSRFVRGLRITTGHRMGRFGRPG